ncbi:DoxX family protein [Fodinicola acaciae]|uniref:DoxX family protein n=1 Tax=Fodinicola acaciae TaxID=2681555 RepID=UPI0013D708C1|nr:DoxX family protein [Fodinicola acaciae]
MFSDLTRTLTGPVLSLFRVVIGLLFVFHGLQHLFGLFGGQPVPFASWPAWYAGVIELVGGGLVLAGLGSRIAALICSGAMAYAYFVVHQPHALLPMVNHGESAALFCWSFLLIAVLGPGPYALGSLVRRQKSASVTA